MKKKNQTNGIDQPNNFNLTYTNVPGHPIDMHISKLKDKVWFDQLWCILFCDHYYPIN